MTFWEYRSMSKHRQTIDYLMPLIINTPYYANFILSWIPKEGRPCLSVTEGDSPIRDWLEFVLIPEAYFYRHRKDIFGGLPGLLPYQLLAQAVVKATLFFLAILMGTVLKDM